MDDLQRPGPTLSGGRADWELLRDETSFIVHDLKTPLAIILSNIAFLKPSVARDPERDGALADIESASRQALRMIANLLDLTKLESRQETPQRSMTRLSSVLRTVLDRRTVPAREGQITLTANVHADPLVEVDADLLLRVLDNILDNAFRFTPPQGRIELSAISLGGRVRITVGDSGPAIPVEYRERVFARFGQYEGVTHRMNVGLGLYFCRRAVERQGGTIRIESTPELPTQLVIELPTEETGQGAEMSIACR
jgi:K+-sensing histidine kinase KdpD